MAEREKALLLQLADLKQAVALAEHESDANAERKAAQRERVALLQVEELKHALADAKQQLLQSPGQTADALAEAERQVSIWLWQWLVFGTLLVGYLIGEGQAILNENVVRLRTISLMEDEFTVAMQQVSGHTTSYSH